MNKLITYTVNPFLTIEVARARVQLFVFDHIERLKAINNAHFATIIANTTLSWEAMFGNIETYDKVLNEQVSFTRQMTNKEHEFTLKVSEMEPSVLVKFKKGSPQYNDIYPHGLSEFHNMGQPMIPAIMDRMVDITATYSGDIGPTWTDELKDIRDSYKQLQTSQKDKMGEVDHTVSDYKVLFGPLCIQLFKNACTIMAEYPEKPDRLLDFFNETLVNFDSHIHPLLIQKHTQEASDLQFGEHDTIVITSIFDGELKYFFAPTADATSGTDPSILASKIKKIIPAFQAGAPNNKYIIFINETDTDAKVEVHLE